ncbi:RNA pseudouridine synthase [bacterium]|nr:RNA pseudouridine synthase [bacterium]
MSDTPLIDPAQTMSPPSPEVLLEDGPLLGVLKPAGLLTQGVPGGIPTVQAWVKDYLRTKYQKPGNVYLGIAHRLDRPVSGVMVFAKNSKAAARLAEQFRDRRVRKFYLCIVEGIPAEPRGTLHDWLLKDAEAAHVTVVASETAGAKPAELDYQVLQSNDRFALIRVELKTGRMHQIRVQLSSRGWPIVGDRQYGSAHALQPPWSNAAHRDEAILLHAERLELLHPIRYDAVTLTAPPPIHWQTCDLWSGLLESVGTR